MKIIVLRGDSKPIFEKQADFKKDHCTSDNCFTLFYMIYKDSPKKNRHLCVTFIALRAVVDSINRLALWSKYAELCKTSFSLKDCVSFFPLPEVHFEFQVQLE